MKKINRKISLVNFTDRNTKPKYIVIHYVGAVSTAKNNADYFYSKYRGASAHYFVDENEIWQVVDDLDSAWHVGSNKYYNNVRNSNSIGIEMCVKKKNGKWYFEEKTVKNTIELVKAKMKQYNIPLSNVCRHYDVTHKTCPQPYVADVKAWNNFLKQLEDKPTKPTQSNGLPKGVEKYSGYVEVIYKGADGIYLHSKPTFSGSVSGNVKKGTVLTVIGRIKVDGVYMYYTKAGHYITSAKEYVLYRTSLHGSVSKPKKKTAKQVADEIYQGKGNWGTNPKRREKLIAYNGVAFADEVQRILNKKF